MNNLNFDATTVEPQSEFSPLPAGEYLVMATSSEIKDTKQQTGKYLQLTLQVLDGPYANRLLFDRINVQNQSAQAQEIGQRALSSLCHAINKLQISDSSELHNIPFIVKVSVRNDQQYGDSNEIKAYKSANGAPLSASIAGATTSAPAISKFATGAVAPATKPAWVK